ncbi:hypothetical protein GMRT_10545 [Giardia muris]|uniref:Transmembrane protein n=1 Tax=Giardia muris TaxID=5742 RepID=A0A4Z1SPS4_GIAMU|nr:hypothetical protein GMRT_10545 [Giardia muris]|eukprot:TNJ26875.1 hypothetical protein GMRT_10545 [Giardia muris]
MPGVCCSKCPLREHLAKAKAELSESEIQSRKDEIRCSIKHAEKPLMVFLAGLTFETPIAFAFNIVVSALLVALAWSLPSNALFNILLVLTLLFATNAAFKTAWFDRLFTPIYSKACHCEKKVDLLYEGLAILCLKKGEGCGCCCCPRKMCKDCPKKALLCTAGLLVVTFLLPAPLLLTLLLVALNLLPFYVKYVAKPQGHCSGGVCCANSQEDKKDE